jgi:uncharacterized protein involved in exopolysaccharide biosynthesis
MRERPVDFQPGRQKMMVSVLPLLIIAGGVLLAGMVGLVLFLLLNREDKPRND